MNFEKEFPTLKNSYIDEKDRIHKLSIMNHCLDRKKVKEKLELLQSGHIQINDIFKELGLDE